ncbi:hypothetical protein ABKV19_004355 [Rosa sericea]
MKLGDAPSFSWRSILESRPVLAAGIQWKVGTGEQVDVWKDNWIPDCLRYLIQKPLHTTISKVAELSDKETRSWNQQVVHATFLPEVAIKILSIPLSRSASVDRYRWKPEKNGKYTVLSAYWIARQQVMGEFLTSTSSGNPYEALWKKIWNTRIPGKVKICLWRAANNILPTRESLSYKGYIGPFNCLLCSAALETSSHVFCHCPVAQEAIEAANIPIASCLPGSFKEWLLHQGHHLNREQWEKLLMLLWALWKNRNSKLWNNTCTNAHGIVVTMFTWYEQFLQAQKTSMHETAAKPSKHWTPPSSNQLKINVDGAFLPSKDFGGIGGVIRRSDGSFVAAFSKFMQHVSSPKQVELLAIREGLDFLKQRGLHDVCLESDCQGAIQEIEEGDCDLNENANLLLDIKQYSKFVHNLKFSFAPRTANFVAHRLAAIAYESNTTQVWIDQAPVSILDAIASDCNRSH